VGVDVVLNQVSQAGTSPKRRRLTQLDVVLDGSDVFARICERSTLPLLSRVDPYGTLILTAAEIPQLIAELDTERGRAAGGPKCDHLADTRRLAERCATEASAELHLEGD
jgi:hypothetical protein